MAYNLARNSRVFVTTNLNAADNSVKTTGFNTNNTWEIQVLDGFKFAQATNSTNIQIKEAGSVPIRGQRAFNTALNPVDITFSTYVRPRLASNVATAEERVLWNALLGSVGITGTVDSSGTVAGVTLGGTPTGTIVRASTTASTATLGGVAMTGAAGLTAGGIYNITGLTGTGAPQANVAIKVVTPSATALVFDFLTAPLAAAGTTLAGVTVPAGAIFTQSAWNEHPTATGVTTSYSLVTSALANKNQLQPLGFIFVVDNTAYTIDNCAMDQAVLDFGLDAIATIAWTAKGTLLNQITLPALSADNDPVFSGSLTGTAVGKVTTANYITNKLSTVSLTSNLNGISGTPYTVVLTGGSITIANGISYVTPNNLGVLNIPIGYFTGTRAISGTMNAYLRTGAGTTSALLAAMLADIDTATETKYKLQIEVGGASIGTRVEFEMPGTVIGIPSVDIADVVSTSITFNAQGTTTTPGAANAAYDLENTNELSIRYYSL